MGELGEGQLCGGQIVYTPDVGPVRNPTTMKTFIPAVETTKQEFETTKGNPYIPPGISTTNRLRTPPKVPTTSIVASSASQSIRDPVATMEVEKVMGKESSWWGEPGKPRILNKVLLAIILVESTILLLLLIMVILCGIYYCRQNKAKRGGAGRKKGHDSSDWAEIKIISDPIAIDNPTQKRVSLQECPPVPPRKTILRKPVGEGEGSAERGVESGSNSNNNKANEPIDFN